MNVGKIFVLMLVMLLASSFVSAVNMDVLYVKINGEEFADINSSQVGTHTDNLLVKRGDDLDIKVRVQALSNLSNVQVEADIYGYRYSYKEENLVSATSKTFDMSQGDIDTLNLKLQVPVKMDKKYTLLRIRVGDEDGLSFEKMYQLHVEGIDSENAVQIKDFSFSPSDVINAGRAFTATVKVENIGDDTLDDIKVQVAVPALNIMDYEYLDELEPDEKETLEEFLLRIPDCAEPGVYDVKITATFDEYESTEVMSKITVLAGDACSKAAYGEEITTVTAPESQETKEGTEIGFPLMITNHGTSSKIYTVTLTGVSDFGTSRLSPGSQIVVKPRDTGVIYAYITPKESMDGQRLFVATVSTDGESKTVPLTLKISGSAEKSDSNGSDVKDVLTIVFVVLVIILIIVGLIVGFNKLRGHDHEDESQTYY